MLNVSRAAMAVAIGLSFLSAVPAAAQDVSAPANQGGTSPDGSRAFGIEPYFGVLGSHHSFDQNSSSFGSSPINGKMDAWEIGGIVGLNVPLGPVFVGVEGNASKGFGDIDWEYGARGRAGFRAGESGMVFLSAGYQWVNGKTDRGFSKQSDWIYGAGIEVGPKDIGLAGITGESGVRLRLQAETYNFESIKPSVGVVFHF